MASGTTSFPSSSSSRARSIAASDASSVRDVTNEETNPYDAGRHASSRDDSNGNASACVTTPVPRHSTCNSTTFFVTTTPVVPRALRPHRSHRRLGRPRRRRPGRTPRRRRVPDDGRTGRRGTVRRRPRRRPSRSAPRVFHRRRLPSRRVVVVVVAFERDRFVDGMQRGKERQCRAFARDGDLALNSQDPTPIRTHDDTRVTPPRCRPSTSTRLRAPRPRRILLLLLLLLRGSIVVIDIKKNSVAKKKKKPRHSSSTSLLLPPTLPPSTSVSLLSCRSRGVGSHTPSRIDDQRRRPHVPQSRSLTQDQRLRPRRISHPHHGPLHRR